MRKTKVDPAAPTTVNVGNWKEGGDAFAQAFGPVLGKLFEAMQAQVEERTDADAPADAATSQTRRGRRRVSRQEEDRRREILEEWESARDAMSREDFCRDKHIPVKQLEAYQAWAQHRKNRRK
jgi:uncharacterized membrane protein YccC